MKRPLLTAFVACALAPAAYGQEALVSETIPLRYITAQSVPGVVTKMQGVEQFTCNLKENSVTVRGSRKAVDTFKTELQAADVQAPTYRIAMRVVRYHVDEQGKRTDTVLFTPTILDLDKMAAECKIAQEGGSGYSVQITPRRETDKTVLLTVEVQELGEQGEVTRSGKNAQSVTLGETTRIVGMTDATDKALRRAVQRGEVVQNRGAYTGYYVEVTPTLQAPSGATRR